MSEGRWIANYKKKEKKKNTRNFELRQFLVS